MAYDRKSLKISFIFRDISSLETAVTSVHVAGTSTSYDPVPDLAGYTATVCEDILSDYATMMNATGLAFANYASLDSLKVAAIDVNGHYLTDAVEHARTGSLITGGSSAVHPQLAVVLSLWSGSVVGKGNYGRMYLPYTYSTLNTNSSVSSSVTQGHIADAAKVFLDALDAETTAISAGTGLRIMSNVGPSKPVLKVRVGRVTDTQRRRRRQLLEDLPGGTLTL